MSGDPATRVATRWDGRGRPLTGNRPRTGGRVLRTPLGRVRVVIAGLALALHAALTGATAGPPASPPGGRTAPAPGPPAATRTPGAPASAPSTGQEFAVWVPVASHAVGLRDNVWRTDLGILNPSPTSPAQVVVTLHLPGRAPSRALTVPAGNQTVLADVVALLGASGAGALEVTSDLPVIVTSRTYDLTPAGSFGQDLRGYRPSEGLKAGQSAWLPQLVENHAFRSNIGLTNTGSTPADVAVTLLDGEGAALATVGVTVSPGELHVLTRPFFSEAGQAALDRACARVTIVSGDGVIATASVVDNLTGAPTSVAMVAAPPTSPCSLASVAEVTTKVTVKAVDFWAAPGGRELLLASGRGGVEALDATTGRRAGAVGLEQAWQSVGDASGRLFVAADRSGVRSFAFGSGDVAPAAIGAAAIGGRALGLAWLEPGRLLVAAADAAGLAVVAVDAGGRPTLAATYGGGRPAAAVAVDRELVAEAAESDGLRLWRWTGGTGLVEVGTIALPGVAWGVQLASGIAYVAAEDGGVHVVDVHDPALPAKLATLRPSSVAAPGQAALGVAVTGPFLAVASATTGAPHAGLVSVYGIARPASPQLLDQREARSASSVALLGRRLAVGREGEGLALLELPRCW